MSITIEGVKVTSIGVCNDSKGDKNVSGHYNLVSSSDRPVATQSFKSFKGFESIADTKIELSEKAKDLIAQLYNALEEDISQSLGLGGS